MKNMRNCHHKAVVSKLISLGLIVDVRIILRDITSEEALSKEIDLIASYGVQNLCNMTFGGDGMSNPTEETRKRISISQKKRFQDPSQRKLLSEAFKGKVPYNKGKTAEELGLLPWKHTPETLEKMKILAKKRGVSQKCREAQKIAITGKKRKPFSELTIEKMRIAAKNREAKKKLSKEAA
jgi:hypothetical protein